jgi:hypothetical protein
VTRAEFAIITLLFLLGGGLFWRIERVSQTEGSAGRTPAVAPSSSRRSSPWSRSANSQNRVSIVLNALRLSRSVK